MRPCRVHSWSCDDEIVRLKIILRPFRRCGYDGHHQVEQDDLQVMMRL